MSSEVSTAVLLAGLLLANIGAIAGFFVSLKVSTEVLKTKFDRLEKDVNNLGNLYRKTTKKQE